MIEKVPKSKKSMKRATCSGDLLPDLLSPSWML
jgi:hypothetical protein